jgi:hypothetical protein
VFRCGTNNGLRSSLQSLVTGMLRERAVREPVTPSTSSLVAQRLPMQQTVLIRARLARNGVVRSIPTLPPRRLRGRLDIPIRDMRVTRPSEVRKNNSTAVLHCAATGFYKTRPGVGALVNAKRGRKQPFRKISNCGRSGTESACAYAAPFVISKSGKTSRAPTGGLPPSVTSRLFDPLPDRDRHLFAGDPC